MRARSSSWMRASAGSRAAGARRVNASSTAKSNAASAAELWALTDRGGPREAAGRGGVEALAPGGGVGMAITAAACSGGGVMPSATIPTRTAAAATLAYAQRAGDQRCDDKGLMRCAWIARRCRSQNAAGRSEPSCTLLRQSPISVARRGRPPAPRGPRGAGGCGPLRFRIRFAREQRRHLDVVEVLVHGRRSPALIRELAAQRADGPRQVALHRAEREPESRRNLIERHLFGEAQMEDLALARGQARGDLSQPRERLAAKQLLLGARRGVAQRRLRAALVVVLAARRVEPQQPAPEAPQIGRAHV